MRRFLTLFIVVVLGMTTMHSCRYVKDAKDTAFKEFSPSALLKKYEYYKDVHAQLSAKLASLEVYKAQIETMKEDYEGIARRDWDRFDKTTMSQWRAELSGMKASYNLLAADYNAAMAKFNYRFCNVGELPQGAMEPLPREYAPYVYE
jgi:hypothetical protein